MHRLRVVLIVVLTLALPWQGYAAQAMIFCDHSQHPAPVSHVHQHHATHAHGDHMQATGEPSSDASGAHADSTCGVCASCCSAAAVAAVVNDERLFNAIFLRFIDLFEPLIGLPQSRLERPPRTFLA